MKVWYACLMVCFLALSVANAIAKDFNSAEHQLLMAWCVLILLRLENIR